MTHIILFWIFAILLILFIVSLLSVGIFFLIKGNRNKMKNLIVIGIGFIAMVIGFIGSFVFSLGFAFQEVFVFIGFVLLVIFTNMTFYKGRKSKAKVVLIVTVILGIIQLILMTLHIYFSINTYYFRVTLDVPYTFLVFNWMAWSSYSAYQKIKNKLVAFVSFILSFNNIPEYFQPKGTTWGDPDNIISLAVFGTTAIISVIFAFGFSLAWMMPNRFKKFFNRNYQLLDEKEYTEEELMNLIREQLANRNN
jgi:hypothetical protein